MENRINAMFPKKKLFLFDTFDSFDAYEFSIEADQGNVDQTFIDAFKHVDLSELMKNMPHPESCVICKGFFPETADMAYDEKFAFVSLDVDLEVSILEGLRFFYPRVSERGMIFVHDYRNNFLFGVRKAVDSYEGEIGRKLVKLPLADGGGTLVIIKS